MRIAHASVLVVLAAAHTAAVAQSDLLPDIIIDEQRLYDNYQSGNELRLSNGTCNIGEGKFYIYGGADNGDGTQEVWQRIFRTDGSYYDTLASNFIYHPTHGHIHVENWANYHLREVLPGDGVGDIVASGGKTSFCILDLIQYDLGLPNADPNGQFFSCSSQTQGLSVGWEDVYSSGLDGQSIDITGIPDGEYWLESVVDPENKFIELNENNNYARIKVTIGSTTGPIDPDAYEPDDSFSGTVGRPIGAVNSPNLGPVNPEITINNLTIEASGDDDYYRFYMPATGTSDDFVRITFQHSLGDIDMALLNSSGSSIATSQGTSNSEQISMSGRAAGWYGVRVYGYSGATTPNYDLTINPSSNGSPSVNVINPPAGDVSLIHGAENYTLTWSTSDPENNETWVTIYANTSPTLDGNEILLPTSINTAGSLGSYVINSAYLDTATYWFFAEVSDGGSTTGDWSEGTITFTPFCVADMDNNAVLNIDDINLFAQRFVSNDLAADIDGNGVLNIDDINMFAQSFVEGCP